MYNITLISTFHSELGKCNSDELYKIIKSINPDVIFEELPSDLFDQIYIKNLYSDLSPETECVKKYLQDHNIKHIPVDIPLSSNLFNNQIEYMLNVFKKYNVYRELLDEQYLMIEQNGFAYLNSEKFSESLDKKTAIEKYLIGFANRDIYRLFHEEQDNRENEMLRNIYNYSTENPYNQAAFLIGCAHRNSIMRKIEEYEAREKLKLNWVFYSQPK